MDNTISRLLGRRIQEKEQLIPSDAKEITAATDDGGAEEAKKETSVTPDMPLIDPVVALCAPDATPHALEPLHPSQLPDPEQKTEVPTEATKPTSPDQALRVMLGMSTAAAKPEITPSTSTETPGATPREGQSGSAESLLSVPVAPILNESSLLAAAGSGMPPPPPPTDIKKAMDVYRKFGGPRT